MVASSPGSPPTHRVGGEPGDEATEMVQWTYLTGGTERDIVAYDLVTLSRYVHYGLHRKKTLDLRVHKNVEKQD